MRDGATNCQRPGRKRAYFSQDARLETALEELLGGFTASVVVAVGEFPISALALKAFVVFACSAHITPPITCAINKLS